jgi:tetratricopeptide (TPR) repeat protein
VVKSGVLFKNIEELKFKIPYMKTLTSTYHSLKLFVVVFVLGLAIPSMQSCGTKVKAENNKIEKKIVSLEIPPLKERTGELAKADEWAKTKEKVNELLQKINKKSDDINSRLKIATIYLAEARITGEHPYYYPAVLQILEGVLSLDPQNFEALTFKSSVLMSQHRFKEALDVAEGAKKINPDNAYIYGVLVDANVELGNYEEAVKMSDVMQKLKPSLESYSRASYLREIYGDYPGSIEAMVLAVQAGLPGSEPYCWSKKTLGYLYEQTGDMKMAENQYLSILAERPSYAFALEGLARVEKSRKKYEAALKYLDEAAAIMPEFSFHEEMADIYALQGETEKSTTKYLEVIEMLKEDAASGHVVYLDLSKIYIKSNQIDSAFVYGMKEYNMRPNNIDVNRNLAEIYLLKKDFTKANEHLQVAMRTGCKNPELLALADRIKTQNPTASK